MARRKAERQAESGVRRAETKAIAAYLTALKGPRPSGSSKAKREGLMHWRAQVEQWIDEEPSPIREVELFQQRLDIDAQLAQLDGAAKLPELETAFVSVAKSWSERTGVSAAALREMGVPTKVLAKAGFSNRKEQ
jgi:hypothetical protein